MERIDMELFEKALEEETEYSPEGDLKKLDNKEITLKILDNFDRLMNAESTNDVSDLTDEDIRDLAKYGKELTTLYKMQRFLSETTWKNVTGMRSAVTRRVL